MDAQKSRRTVLRSGSIVAIASVTGCIGLPGLWGNDEGLPLTIENQRNESYKIAIEAIMKSGDKRYTHTFSIGGNEELTRAGFLSEVEDGTYKIKVSVGSGQNKFFSDLLEFPADFTGRHLYIVVLDDEKQILIYATFND